MDKTKIGAKSWQLSCFSRPDQIIIIWRNSQNRFLENWSEFERDIHHTGAISVKLEEYWTEFERDIHPTNLFQSIGCDKQEIWIRVWAWHTPYRCYFHEIDTWNIKDVLDTMWRHMASIETSIGVTCGREYVRDIVLFQLFSWTFSIKVSYFSHCWQALK